MYGKQCVFKIPQYIHIYKTRESTITEFELGSMANSDLEVKELI